MTPSYAIVACAYATRGPPSVPLTIFSSQFFMVNAFMEDTLPGIPVSLCQVFLPESDHAREPPPDCPPAAAEPRPDDGRGAGGGARGLGPHGLPGHRRALGVRCPGVRRPRPDRRLP